MQNPPSTPPPTGPAPELFAVIAGAVYATLGPNARVASVQVSPVTAVATPATVPWSLEGRRQIYASHRVR
jgi:hypothetical protein